MIPFDKRFSTCRLASQLKDSVADNVDHTEFVSLSLRYHLVKYPSQDAILQLRQGNKDVISLLDHPFLIDLNKAEVLAISRASLGPNGTFNSHLHKQALQCYDSGIFTSHLLAKCLCLTLDQKSCQAIENDSSIRHTSDTPYLLQDGLWVFVWIVWAIMPSELCYKSVVTNAECKLKITVPADQRTTHHYCAFLDKVSCFAHHSQDLGSHFLKMFAAFSGCQDIEITTYIWAHHLHQSEGPQHLHLHCHSQEPPHTHGQGSGLERHGSCHHYYLQRG
jgi:hypothetical protein